MRGIQTLVARVAAITLASFLVACDHSTPGPSPIPTVGPPAPTQTPRGSVRGLVFQSTGAGRIPVSGVRLLLPCGYDDYICTSYEVLSDGNGQFGFSDLLQFGRMQKISVRGGTPLFLACAVHTVIGEDAIADVELFERGIQPGTARSPALSGVVFETTSTGRRPVAGVRVGFSTYTLFSEETDAFTETDNEGRYRLCNLSTGSGVLGLICGTQSTQQFVTVSGDATVDFDVTAMITKC